MGETEGWDWGKSRNSIWETADSELVELASAWRSSGVVRVLDLGCGIGRHALHLAENGFSVTAYDISSSGLDRLAAAAAERGLSLYCVRGDMHSLPFDDAEFDAIVAFNSIYHCDAEGMALAVGEIARCLRPGGRLYATFIASCSMPPKSSESPPPGTAGLPSGGETRLRWKREEEGSVLPHTYVDEPELRCLLADFLLRDLRLEDQPPYDGASRHYRVSASRVGAS